MDYLIELVKTYLDIQTTAYDMKIMMLTSAAKSKLKNEGIPYFEKTAENNDIYMDYAVCISCQVAKDLDIDVDLDKLDRLYLQRLIPLKEAVKYVELS